MTIFSLIRRMGRATGALITMLALLLVGCDNFDPAALMPKGKDLSSNDPVRAETHASNGLADAAADKPNAAPDRSRAADMESIGPGNSQRIYYQFVDDRGRVQFVERLSDVPEAWRSRVGYVEMSQPPPLTPLDARRSWKLSASRTTEILLATASASPASRGGQSASVVLYSASWCG